MANFKGYLRDKNGNKIYNDEYDTGWIDLTLVGNATLFTNGRNPQYRKVGNIVYLRGVLKMPYSADVTPIAYLPVGCGVSQTYENFIVRSGTGSCICGIGTLDSPYALWLQLNSDNNETSLANISFVADC